MSLYSQAEQIEANSKKWGVGHVVLVLIIPIAVLLISSLVLVNRLDTKKRSQNCMERNGERRTTIGVVKQAGQTLFIFSDRWHAITYACTGKTAASCRAANPGIAALESNIGQPVVVEFCENDVVAYTVAGIKFLK